jgi:cytochrome c oxidase subunit 3
MFFAALAFAVSYLRMREPWPTEGALALPRLLPGLGVLLLAIGSGLLHSARRRPARWRLGGAIVLGTAFLMQQALLASSLWNSGLRLPAGGAYASAFYGLMAVHALHAGVGLLGLTRVARGFEQDAHAPQRLRLWTLYWHFVTVTGWLFFAAVYLP